MRRDYWPRSRNKWRWKRISRSKARKYHFFVNIINYLFFSGDLEGWRKTEARAKGLGSGDCSPVTDLEFVKQFTPAKLLIALDSTDKFHYNPITHVDTDSSGENKHVSGFSHTCVENAKHLQTYNCVAFFTHVCLFPYLCVKIQTCVENSTQV